MDVPCDVIDEVGRRWRLVRQIGGGGQGTVYAIAGERHAAKILHPKAAAATLIRDRLAYIRRLPLDGMALARPIALLRAPLVGYVMQLLRDMVPLETLCAAVGTSACQWYIQTGGLRRRLRLLANVADIFAELHCKGLAYGDPSPKNIFVAPERDQYDACLIDLDNLSHMSAIGTPSVYSPGYGAPEIVAGRDGVSSLSDAYSFAVIAFEVLAACHPFIGDAVENGDPEMEELAFAGGMPFVDDKEDDSNRTSRGVPRECVLSPGLQSLFSRAFGAGRTEPQSRPGILEWAERLHAAADATIQCRNCPGTYFPLLANCPHCGMERPSTLSLRVFAANGVSRHGTAVGCVSVVPGETRQIDYRVLQGFSGREGSRGALSVAWDGHVATVRALDDTAWDVVLGSRVRVLDNRGVCRVPADEDTPALRLRATVRSEAFREVRPHVERGME